MKRSVSFLISVMLIIGSSLVYAAGGGQQASGSQAAGGKPTITIGMAQDARITDYKNNYMTRVLENSHNINIEFYMMPSDAADARTKIALMVASQDLPDVLMSGLTPEMILEYGSNGVLVAYNKWLQDPVMAPNFTKIKPELKPLITNAITMADGNIYGFPMYQPEPWNLAYHRLWINTTWLDKLGLPTPTTTAELKTALLAFRDRDPNGNGRRDEIGITGLYTGTYGEDVITALINAFVFYNKGTLSLDTTGTKVTAPFTEQGFRDALIYLNDLYREGVLDAGLFTYNLQEFGSILNAEPMTVGFVAMGSTGNFPGAGTYDNVNYNQIMIIPPLKGPSGVGYSPYTDPTPPQYGFIASTSRNQEAAFKMLENFMDIELSMIARWGEEGVNWTRDPAELEKYKVKNAYVMTGVYPSLQWFVYTDIWANPSDKYWHNINPRYAPVEEVNVGRVAYAWSPDYDPDDKNTKLGVIHAEHYPNAHPQYILPQLKYTMDEATDIAEATTNVNEYVSQSIAEFITSVRDINSNTAWNAYLRELDNMGLQKWLTTAQTTYNRQR
jgi:putative aldouronate transport system substrate-binding protein